MFAGQPINNFLLSQETSLKFFHQSPLKYIYEIIFLLIGGLRIAAIFLSQSSIKDNNMLKNIDHLVGTTQFGYLENLEYRHKNYFKLFNKKLESKHLMLDEYDRKAFSRIARISFIDLFKELRVNAKESSTLLSQIRSIKLLALVLPISIKNIALFSYLSLLFRHIKAKKNDVKFFSGGSELCASAALKAGISTYLLKHGSMSKVSKYCFLDYSHVYVYSKDDLDYIKKISPTTKVSIYKCSPVLNQSNKVILFGAQRDLKELNLLSEITNFFTERGVESFYKCHPVMTEDQQKLVSQSLGIELVNDEIDGAELIQKLQPRFCIGWASTAICESLNAGVIPICTQRDSEQEELKEHAILYPFIKRSLFWFRDQHMIAELLDNRKFYESTILSLQDKK